MSFTTMTKDFETWEGNNYVVREVLLPENLGGYHARIADYELYAAIQEAYEDIQHPRHEEAMAIDNSIYYYCDSGFVASDPEDEEIINKLSDT